MKKPHDLALRFIELAEKDLKTFNILLESEEAPLESIGFHAQQIIEKSLKALLIKNSIEFRRTHNIDELIDIIEDNKLPMPPMLIG